MKLRKEKQAFVIEINENDNPLKFTVEPLTFEEEENFLRDCTRKVSKPVYEVKKGGFEKSVRGNTVKMEIVDDFQVTKFRIAKFDRLVKAWEGIEDECTAENKAILVQNYTGVVNRVFEETDRITSGVAIEKAESEKN